MAVEYKRMQQIRGTSAQWLADDIVLLDGEIAVERLSGGGVKLKLGDGVTAYAALPYLLPAPLFVAQGAIDATSSGPSGGSPGAVWINSGTGIVDAAWGAPAEGTDVVPGDQVMMMADHAWAVIPVGSDLSGYVRKGELDDRLAALEARLTPP